MGSNKAFAAYSVGNILKKQGLQNSPVWPLLIISAIADLRYDCLVLSPKGGSHYGKHSSDCS